MFKAGRNITKEKPKSSIEETDSRLIQHLIEAKRESQRVVVILNDTDVVAYCLTHKNRCRFYGCKEVCVCSGAGDKTRDIPIYALANKLEIIYHLQSFFKHMCLLGVM